MTVAIWLAICRTCRGTVVVTGPLHDKHKPIDCVECARAREEA